MRPVHRSQRTGPGQLSDQLVHRVGRRGYRLAVALDNRVAVGSAVVDAAAAAA